MISTHVLDTARGCPAAGISVLLESVDGSGARREVGRDRTDADGRVRELATGEAPMAAGTYCLTFDTGQYFASLDTETFYPRVSVVFTVRDPTRHHHVPLLISPYGYSTYRGT